MYGVYWYPPDPKTVPCCVLQYYRPLPDAYCCNYLTLTDLEIQAIGVQTYNKYNPDLIGYKCCLGRNR